VFYLTSQNLAGTHALLAHGSAAANSVHEVSSALEIFFTPASPATPALPSTREPDRLTTAFLGRR